ncbi:MAG: flagellar export protein FliJ [Planctomycetes bacterium]|nr:flagellar export protein FliJ [Planctomycetota bacterium]
MKRFRFSLERLLSYRQAQVDAAEREFGGVLAQVEKLAFEIRTIEEEREERARSLLEQRLSAETRREVVGGHSYLQVMWLRMVRLRKELQTWRDKLHDARLRLEETRRELKAVETLRERAMEKHKADELREETRDADEAARNSYLRNRRKEEMPDA